MIIVEHSDPLSLARALAQHVSAQLKAAVVSRGVASLALSGGRTPKLFLEVLGKVVLDWSKIEVTIVDERVVPISDERSNARFICSALAVPGLRFTGLITDLEATAEELAETAEAALAHLPWPMDVIVLGMGEDGHTASWFPNDPALPTVLDPQGTRRVLAALQPETGERRLTLSAPAITSARSLFFHIEGAAKRRVIENARDPAGALSLPVGIVLQSRPDCRIYYSA